MATRLKRRLGLALATVFLVVGTWAGQTTPAHADILIGGGTSVYGALDATGCYYNWNCASLYPVDYCNIVVSSHYTWFYYNRYDWVYYCWYYVWQ